MEMIHRFAKWVWWYYPTLREYITPTRVHNEEIEGWEILFEQRAGAWAETKHQLQAKHEEDLRLRTAQRDELQEQVDALHKMAADGFTQGWKQQEVQVRNNYEGELRKLAEVVSDQAAQLLAMEQENMRLRGYA